MSERQRQQHQEQHDQRREHDNRRDHHERRSHERHQPAAMRTPPPSPARPSHVLARGSPGRLIYRTPDSPTAPDVSQPPRRRSGLRFLRDFMNRESANRTVTTSSGERVTYQSLPTNDLADRPMDDFSDDEL